MLCREWQCKRKASTIALSFPVANSQRVSSFICVQDAENKWQFDIFAFAKATPGTSLAVMTFHLMKQAGLMSDFSLDQGKLWNFLRKIEGGYKAANPYHNRSAFGLPPTYSVSYFTFPGILLAGSRM